MPALIAEAVPLWPTLFESLFLTVGDCGLPLYVLFVSLKYGISTLALFMLQLLEHVPLNVCPDFAVHVHL